MPETLYRVNYFVGALLAQGGNLKLDNSKIVFSPTSAIDRAMGAKDVEIPLDKIRGLECSGGLSRTFRIIVDDRVHKFEGTQAQKFWELLQQSLPQKTNIVPVPGIAKKTFSCPACTGALQPNFKFCPYCGCKLLSKAA